MILSMGLIDYHSQQYSSLRIVSTSIFISRVVTSDVISTKLPAYSQSWKCRAQFFVISNPNLNMKIGCKCNNKY